MKEILLDTGPLVAILSHRDQYHEECVEVMKSVTGSPLTTWAVLTEAAWMLRSNAKELKRLCDASQSGDYTLADIGADALPWIGEFLHRYRKQGAQFADATLVYLAERDDIETVFTLDRRDFSIFRFRKNTAFHIIP